MSCNGNALPHTAGPKSSNCNVLLNTFWKAKVLRQDAQTCSFIDMHWCRFVLLVNWNTAHVSLCNNTVVFFLFFFKQCSDGVTSNRHVVMLLDTQKNLNLGSHMDKKKNCVFLPFCPGYCFNSECREKWHQTEFDLSFGGYPAGIPHFKGKQVKEIHMVPPQPRGDTQRITAHTWMEGFAPSSNWIWL